MNKNETHADIVAEMRHGFNQSWHDIDREWAHGLADRAKAAHKREVDNLNSVIQTQRSHFDAEMAKMRKFVRRIVESLGGKAEVAPTNMTPHEVAILNQCRAALEEKPEKAIEEVKKDEDEEFENPPPLARCPKCGEDAARFIHPTFDGGSYVRCDKCFFSPQAETWATTDARAAIKWNNLERSEHDRE